MQSYNNYLQKMLKQLKVNHNNSYHKSNNNSQVQINDKKESFVSKDLKQWRIQELTGGGGGGVGGRDGANFCKNLNTHHSSH